MMFRCMPRDRSKSVTATRTLSPTWMSGSLRLLRSSIFLAWRVCAARAPRLSSETCRSRRQCSHGDPDASQAGHVAAVAAVCGRGSSTAAASVGQTGVCTYGHNMLCISMVQRPHGMKFTLNHGKRNTPNEYVIVAKLMRKWCSSEPQFMGL